MVGSGKKCEHAVVIYYRFFWLDLLELSREVHFFAAIWIINPLYPTSGLQIPKSYVLFFLKTFSF